MSALDQLHTALSAYLAAERLHEATADAHAFIAMVRAEWRLTSVAIDCGMERDVPSVVAWAVQRTVRDLCEAA